MKVHNDNDLPTIPIADLLPSQGNLKDLTEQNYKKLKAVIENRGFSVPVYVWEDEKKVKHLLDGHQRQRVLTTEGWNEPIPYLKIRAKNIQEAMARLLEITSQYATITQEGIDEFIGRYELNEQEVLQATSYDALGSYGAQEPELDIVEDKAPELDESEPAKSEPGEVYQLGDHRLMCGSSTEDVDVAQLLADQTVNLIYTDPPYGVDYVSSKLGKIMNDELKGDSLYQLVYDSFSIAIEKLEQDSAIYCWYEDKYRHIFQKALEDLGLELKQNLIWNKGMNLSGADYQKAHENLLYLQIKNGKAKWFGDRDKKTILGQRRTDLNTLKKQDLVAIVMSMQSQSTVWDIDKDLVTTYEHPTQKPVRLSARAILNSSESGDNVYDGFIGSGSTLIACEQTERTCYGMELDPKYVDVIRKRYAKFTAPDSELPKNWEELTPAIARK